MPARYNLLGQHQCQQYNILWSNRFYRPGRPESYAPLRKFLREQGVRHILLTGYATDMCFCRTTAGFENLSQDFNVFLVGDATLATFPANDSPRYATNAHISFAALNQLVTQVSWVTMRPADEKKTSDAK